MSCKTCVYSSFLSLTWGISLVVIWFKWRKSVEWSSWCCDPHLYMFCCAALLFWTTFSGVVSQDQISMPLHVLKLFSSVTCLDICAPLGVEVWQMHWYISISSLYFSIKNPHPVYQNWSVNKTIPQYAGIVQRREGFASKLYYCSEQNSNVNITFS